LGVIEIHEILEESYPQPGLQRIST